MLRMLRLLLSLVRDDPRARAVVWSITIAGALVGVLRVATLGAAFLALEPLLSAEPEVSWPAILTMLVLVIVTLACLWVRVGFESTRSDSVATSISLTLARHANRLPLGWFTRTHQTELTELTTGFKAQIAGALSFRHRMLVEAATIPVTSVLVGVWIDPWLGLILAAAAAAMTASALSADKPVNRTLLELIRSTDAALSELTDFVQAQPVLRAATGTDAVGTRVVRAFEGMDDADRRQRSAVSIRTAMIPALLTALAVTAIVIATVTVPLTTAALTVGIALVLETGAALHAFGRAWAYNTAFTTRLARVRAILDEPPLPEPMRPSQPACEELTLNAVTFGYHADSEAVLHDVSLTFPAGSVTALVGRSGAGKSTLLRLLARFWDPGAGSVALGGIDLREVGTAGVHERIGFVFQDVFLVDGTLRENVLLARPAADAADLAAAASHAGLDDVLAELPEGWDTPVGERGASLSGGQRQRVSIARAFLKNAPVLLLDEPTASLDAENERRIGESIRALSVGRTVVMVTHRLDAAREADRIVVVDRGRVVQTGTHEQLAGTPGVYTELLAAHGRTFGHIAGGLAR